MCRVLPKAPTPAWEAPLLNPACKPICPSWARNCSSLNSRSFLSAILGPKRGPVYSACFWVCRSRWHCVKLKKFENKKKQNEEKQKQKIEKLISVNISHNQNGRLRTVTDGIPIDSMRRDREWLAECCAVRTSPLFGISPRLERRTFSAPLGTLKNCFDFVISK